MQKFLPSMRKMKETLELRIASHTMTSNVRGCWIRLLYLSEWKSPESPEETAVTEFSF